MAVLAVAVTAYSVLQSLVVPALATVQRELHTGAAATAWVLTTYLVSASVLTPVAGRLADLFGKRPVLAAALGLLSLGCVVSALAGSLPVMLLGRAVQGSGGAVFPLAFAIVGDVVPGHRRTSVVAALSAVLSAGGAAGTVLAGPVIAVAGYHGLFWVPALVTAAAAVAAWLAVPAQARTGRPLPVGWVGAGLMAAWLTCLLLAISLLGRSARWWPASGALLVLAAVGARWWWRRESRAGHPLVDPAVLAAPQLRAANSATLLLGFGMFGAWMLLPLLAQQDPATGAGLGVPAARVWLVMIPGVVGTLLVTRACAPVARRLADAAPVAIGGAVAGLAYLGLALWHDRLLVVVGWALLEGMGIGLAFAGIAGWVLSSVDRSMAAVVSGVNTVARTVGGTLGTTAAGGLLQAWATHDGVPRGAAYGVSFTVFGVSLLAAGAVAADAAARAAHQRRRSAGEEPDRARGTQRRDRSAEPSAATVGTARGGPAVTTPPAAEPCRSARSTSAAPAGRANQ
ncbi:MAG: MFS transporter [Kineosporiaceae bacterium]